MSPRLSPWLSIPVQERQLGLLDAISVSAASPDSGSLQKQGWLSRFSGDLRKAIAHIVESGDVCGYLQLEKELRLTKPELLKEFETHLSELHENQHPLYAQDLTTLSMVSLLRTDSRDALERLDSADTRSLFLKGLLLSDQVSAMENQNTNYHLSRELLEELRARDPKNAAMDFFLIGAKSFGGSSRAAIAEDMRTMFGKAEFETRWLDVFRLLWEYGLSSPLNYIWSVGVRAQLPIPDYMPAQMAIREAIAVEDEEFAKQALEFGRLIQKRHRANATGIEGVDWNAVEFQIGRAIGKTAWERLYPGEPLPLDLQETYRDLNRHSPMDDIAFIEHAVSPEGVDSCDLNAWRRHIALLRDRTSKKP